MALKQSVKYTIGKEDGGTPGTAVARTAVLPIRDIGSLDRDIVKKTDPLIAGLGMDVGEYAVAGDVKGSIPLSPRPCTGWGHVLKGQFGAEGTPAQVVGLLRIKYTGASASCKITTDLAAKTINSKIGDLGAEANDAAFGTAGTLTLTAITVDTVGELRDVINAYADYECEIVTGAVGTSIVSVVAGVFQGKGKWAMLWLTGTGSGAYLHKFTPDLTLGSARPTYSVQRDGYEDNYLYDGIAMGKLSLSAALKADVEADIDVIGMKETAGQSASALAVPSAKPYRFGGGFTSVAGTKYSNVRKHSVSFDNSMMADGYGQDSIDRSYHERGKFLAEGGLTLRLDSVSVLERAKAESGASLAVQFMYFEVENTFALSVRGLMLVEIPYAEISETPKPEANGDSLDLGIKFKGFNPGTATDYEAPVSIAILTADSTAY